MKTSVITVALTAILGLFSDQASAADLYDVLLARIAYLEQDCAARDQLVETIDSGDFDLMNQAAQVGYDYACAMDSPPPYDDGSVEGAVNNAIDGMLSASAALASAMQARLNASIAANDATNFAVNGQYDNAVAAYEGAAYDDTMGFGMFQMELGALAGYVADAQYWLANWPEDPMGGMMP